MPIDTVHDQKSQHRVNLANGREEVGPMGCSGQILLKNFKIFPIFKSEEQTWSLPREFCEKNHDQECHTPRGLIDKG